MDILKRSASLHGLAGSRAGIRGAAPDTCDPVRGPHDFSPFSIKAARITLTTRSGPFVRWIF